jgi:hypothetical protein
MKSFLLVLRHLLSGRPGVQETSVLRKMFLFGVLLLAATPLVYFRFGGSIAFQVSVAAYAGLVAPCMASPVLFSQLLSSRRMALLPSLSMKAILALLLITVVTALYLPLSASLLLPQARPADIAMRAFFMCSVIALAGQWIPASGRPSYLFFIIVLLMQQPVLRSRLGEIPEDPRLLLAVALIAWLVALVYFARLRSYRRLSSLPTSHSVSIFMISHLSVFPSFGGPLQRSSSGGGTLLLGYPDSWLSRGLLYGKVVLFWPLVTALVVVLGAGLPSGNVPLERFGLPFLLTSFVFSAYSAIGYVDLPARARLLWLRAGGDRNHLWRILEWIMLGNFLILALLLTLACLLVELASGPVIRPLQILNFVPMTFATHLFVAYYVLASRAGQWSLATLAPVSVVGVFAIFALMQRAIPPPLIALFILTLALLFRNRAKRYFLRVDWRLVQPLRYAVLYPER